MKCRLRDLSISLDGKQLLTVELDGDFRSQWDELSGKDCEITVKRYRKRRSLDANAYCWVLIDKIAQKKRITRAEAYRNAIREVGGVSDIVCVKNCAVERLKQQWEAKGMGWQVETFSHSIPGWTNVILYYGSSVYDTKQFSDLLSNVIEDARSLGIEVEDENKINSMLEEYDAKSNRYSRETDKRS